MEIIGKNWQQRAESKRWERSKKRRILQQEREKKRARREEMLMSAHVSALSVFSETKQLPDTPSSSFRSQRSPPKCQQYFPCAGLLGCTICFRSVGFSWKWSIKGIFQPEIKLCNHFLTLVSFQTHMTSFHETHAVFEDGISYFCSCSDQGLKLLSFTKHAKHHMHRL